MPLKIIDNFDSSFALDPDAKTLLFELLKNEGFLNQVASQIISEISDKAPDQANDDSPSEDASCRVEFTELLFQPVPYTTVTPKGMPAEFEKYHTSADHIIINVPPNFMFKAKIFKPSRLCAIYRKAKS
jgi:hypothetical protein